MADFWAGLFTVIVILQGTVSDLLREGRGGIDVRTGVVAGLVLFALVGGGVLYGLILFRLTRNYFRFRGVAEEGDDRE